MTLVTFQKSNNHMWIVTTALPGSEKTPSFAEITIGCHWSRTQERERERPEI